LTARHLFIERCQLRRRRSTNPEARSTFIAPSQVLDCGSAR
jgi:hypothetical protein